MVVPHQLLTKLDYADDIIEAFKKDFDTNTTKEFRLFDTTDPMTLFKDFDETALDDVMKIKANSFSVSVFSLFCALGYASMKHGLCFWKGANGLPIQAWK